MEKKKLIIWDFDGPIVDSRALALEFTQYHYHDVTEHTHRNLFNGNIFDALATLKKKDISSAQQNAFLETSYWPRKLKLAPVPGIRRALENLSKDFTMVINSSSKKKQVARYVEKNNLTKFFTKVYGDEIKSKEEKFKLILSKFKVVPEDCLLITDTLGDVLEAETLNISSMVVLWGYQTREHFNSVTKKVVFVENPSEIINMVKKHFSKL